MKIYETADNIIINIVEDCINFYDKFYGNIILITATDGKIKILDSDYEVLIHVNCYGEIEYVVSPRDSADTTIDVAFNFMQKNA